MIYCLIVATALRIVARGEARPTQTGIERAAAQGRTGHLYNVLILADRSDGDGLADAVGRAGMTCRLDDSGELPWETDGSDLPDAVLLHLASLGMSGAKRAVGGCRDKKVPVLVALRRDAIGQYDPTLNPDELLICPTSDDELSLRVQQAVFRVKGPSGSQTLTIGDLSIDLERYEVSVAGRRVTLTYKEFQLLALLASNPGRVYTRDALLSQVWGYDYLGGTRTVDVHVRRLRSKVESPGRSFVETIWNVGYRFKAPN